MKKTAIIALLALTVITFVTCKKIPELKVYGFDFESVKVNYSQTSAEVKADYIYPTPLKYVNVTLSQSQYFGDYHGVKSEVNDSLIIANFSGLEANKTYYYKFEYSNGVNVETSDVRNFKLDAAQVTLPTVYTMEVYDVTGESAMCGGEIIDDAGELVTARGVCWSTHKDPTIYDKCTTDGMGTGWFESYITGLQKNTQYYVKAYAINKNGTSYGEEYSFTTTSDSDIEVSTEPSNRNVVIEMFGGRDCGFDLYAHVILNEITYNYPGRVFVVGNHTGEIAPTSYPNFNNEHSARFLEAFGDGYFPAGVVNRSTNTVQGRELWASLTQQQLEEEAECNIAGAYTLDYDNRRAYITVKVYYTRDTDYDENYLTIAMIQDKILGGQQGPTDVNPSQWVGDQYMHMNVLRDVVTDTWGDPIGPTTQGSLITMTYEYEIPQVIGSPNGVTVDLDNITFLAWVTEYNRDGATVPILNACKVDRID